MRYRRREPARGPATWRGYEAGPEGIELLVIGTPNLGDDPRADIDGERDWWSER